MLFNLIVPLSFSTNNNHVIFFKQSIKLPVGVHSLKKLSIIKKMDSYCELNGQCQVKALTRKLEKKNS